MTNLIRTVALGALVAAGLVASQPSQAQNVVINGHLIARLSPSPLPYPGRGRVPSQCLPYAYMGHQVMYCDPGTNGASVLPTPFDKQVDLIYAGPKPFGFRTPDFCILRKMGPTFGMFCQHTGW